MGDGLGAMREEEGKQLWPYWRREKWWGNSDKHGEETGEI